MNADELRAAAEATLNYVATGDNRADYDFWRAHAIALARGVIAEHPADDGNRPTPEWLRSVGAVEEGDPGEFVFLFDDLNPALTLTDGNNDGIWCAMLGGDGPGGDSDGDPWPHDIHHRSQVRDILRALGIPLEAPR